MQDTSNVRQTFVKLRNYVNYITLRNVMNFVRKHDTSEGTQLHLQTIKGCQHCVFLWGLELISGLYAVKVLILCKGAHHAINIDVLSRNNVLRLLCAFDFIIFFNFQEQLCYNYDAYI